MAVPTPAILPVPTVADIDVIKALKPLMSPLLLSPLRPDHNVLNAKGMWLKVRPFKPRVKNKPVKANRISIGAPHTTPLMAPRVSVVRVKACSIRVGAISAGLVGIIYRGLLLEVTHHNLSTHRIKCCLRHKLAIYKD